MTAALPPMCGHCSGPADLCSINIAGTQPHMQLHTEQADANMKVEHGTPKRPHIINIYILKVILIAGFILAVAEAMPQGYAAVETYPDEPPVYTYTYG